MLGVLKSTPGRWAINDAIARTGKHIMFLLGTDALGGSIIQVDIALVSPSGEVTLLRNLALNNGKSESQDEQDYGATVLQMRARSARLGISCRKANLLGCDVLPNETRSYGNEVFDLENGYKLIISCAGLSEDNNEKVACHIGYGIELLLPWVVDRLSVKVRV